VREVLRHPTHDWMDIKLQRPNPEPLPLCRPPIFGRCTWTNGASSPCSRPSAA
jgi:hypothetical protein